MNKHAELLRREYGALKKVDVTAAADEIERLEDDLALCHQHRRNWMASAEKAEAELTATRNALDDYGRTDPDLPTAAEKVMRHLSETQIVNAALRQIISECVEVLGNGSHVAPDASLDFMRDVPKEIGNRLGEGWAELTEAKRWLEKLKDPACVRANMMCEKIGMLPEVLECPKLREELAAVKGQLEAALRGFNCIRKGVLHSKWKEGDCLATAENFIENITIPQCNTTPPPRTYTAEEVRPLVEVLQYARFRFGEYGYKTSEEICSVAVDKAARLGLVKEGGK